MESLHFLRRDWLAEDIQRQLDRDDVRIVLLTAVPGAGKSACLAQLAHDHQTWPRYFIRRDQRAPLADPTARGLLLRVGFQLASVFPELFTTEQIRIEVTQRFGEVADGGHAVGAEVKRLLTSPFHQTVMHITQDVERARGKATGLQIGEWVSDPLLVESADLQRMALFDPAHALQRMKPGVQLVVLIDALDESAAIGGEQSLLEWLAHLPELPPNLRLVVASRPSLDVTALLERQSHVLAHVGIAAHDDRVAGDLRRYTRHLSTLPPAARTLAEAGRDPGDFVREAMLKANGNIGYLDALARAVDEAGISIEAAAALGDLLALRELPQHITGLYRFFLRQIRSTAGARDVRIVDPLTGRTGLLDAWAAVYRPLLEVLSIASEPVGLDELRALGGIIADPSDLATALRRLGQFLAEEKGRHRFYHATLAEFVTAPELRTEPELHVDVVGTHSQVARRLRHLFAESWTHPHEQVAPSVYRYALTHCASHLYEGHLWKELFELLDAGDYGAAKPRAGLTPAAYLADLALGIAAARHEATVDSSAAALPRLFRYPLLSHMLSSIETTRAPTVHAAWLLLGDDRRLPKLNETIPDPRLRAKTLADAAMALLGEAGTEPGDDWTDAGATAARAAVSALIDIADEDTALGVLDDLLAVWQRLSDLGVETDEGLVTKSLGLADTAVPSTEHVRVLAAAAVFLWGVDEQAARQLLDRTGQHASCVARSVPVEQLDTIWGPLAVAYSVVGQLADAEATSRRLHNPALRTAVTAHLAEAEVRRGNLDGARSRLEAAEAALSSVQLDFGTRASARVNVASGWLTLGDTARATALTRAAVGDVDGEELPSDRTTHDLVLLLDHLGMPDEAQRLAVQLHDAAMANERSPRVVATSPAYPLWAALALANADRPELALAVMREMDPVQRAAPGKAVAAAFVRQGRFNEALAVVEVMRDAETSAVQFSVLPPWHSAESIGGADDALLVVVTGLLGSGAVERAYEVAPSADTADARSHITGAIALHEIAAGSQEAAKALLAEDEQNLRLTSTTPIRHHFTGDVLELLVRHGDVGTARQRAEDADLHGGYETTNLLARILVDSSQSAAASPVIAGIADPLQHADALVYWGANADDNADDAVHALVEAQNLVRGLSAADRRGVLYRAGIALADLDKIPAAQSALRAAETAWRKDPAENIVPSYGSRLAGALARVGLVVEADALADRLPDSWLLVDRAHFWVAIAKALDDQGDRAGAVDRLHRAVCAVRPGEFTESWDYSSRTEMFGMVSGLLGILGAESASPPEGDLSAGSREEVRAGKARALTEAGRPAVALALYGESDRPEDRVLVAIASAFTALGQYEDSLAQLERIDSKFDQLLGYAALAKKIGAGDDRARDAAIRAAKLFGEMRESPRSTRYCAGTVAEALMCVGARDELRELIARQWCGSADAVELTSLLRLAGPLLSASTAREVASSVDWLEDFLSRMA
ncbi:hypothetical protein [Streptomyces sp. ODS28]|uniref:hypothetical protein n=1 Tax=Streptomyces sp. ODS28 TaxID=3136688 RepID=UPI0031E5A1E8